MEGFISIEQSLELGYGEVV